MSINRWVESKLFRHQLQRCAPVQLPKDGEVGICTVVCSKYRDLLIHTLLSFYFVTQKAIPCMVVDDGTLTARDKAKIRYFFPGITITDYSSATNKLQKALRRYPHCLKYRTSVFEERLNMKLFDPFMLAPFPNIIYMDCDIIYYRKPKEILAWVVGNKKKALFSSEYDNVYPERVLEDKAWRLVTSLFRERINPAMDIAFTSGLFCISKKQYDLRRIEELLSYMYRVGLAETWTTEQFIFAVLAAEMNSATLPPSYRHIPFAERLAVTKDTICIHFAYQTKSYYVPFALQRMRATHCYTKSDA